MFDPSGYFFYILLAIIIATNIFSWYRSKDLNEPQKALRQLRDSLLIFAVIVIALMFNLPFFWSAPYIDAENINTLDKAVKAIQEQNEHLKSLNKGLNEFRFVVFFFMQIALAVLCFAIYNFAKALVNKDKDPEEDRKPVNILGLHDEKIT